MKKEQAQQLEEHEWCNTPDCCMKCDTAVPVQTNFIMKGILWLKRVLKRR